MPHGQRSAYDNVKTSQDSSSRYKTYRIQPISWEDSTHEHYIITGKRHLTVHEETLANCCCTTRDMSRPEQETRVKRGSDIGLSKPVGIPMGVNKLDLNFIK